MKSLLLLLVLSFFSSLQAQEIVKSTMIGNPTDHEWSANLIADDAGNKFIGGAMSEKALIVKQNSLHYTLWSKTLTFPPVADNHVSISFMDVLADTVFGCGVIEQNFATAGTFYFKMNAQTGDIYWSKYETTSTAYLSSMRYANGKYFMAGGTQGGNLHYAKVLAVSSQTGDPIWQTPLLSYTFPGSGPVNRTAFIGSTEMQNGKMFITGMHTSIAGSTPFSDMPVLIGISESGNIFLERRVPLPNFGFFTSYDGTRIEYDADGNIIFTCANHNGTTANDPGLTMIKVDPLGNTIFSKDYEIDGDGNAHISGLNETSDSYVLCGSIHSNFTGLCILKLDKNGEFQKCIGVQKPSTFYGSGAVNGYGNSNFKNGTHYFPATEMVVPGGDGNINQIIIDEELNTMEDCAELSELPVLITNLNIQLEPMQRGTLVNDFTYQNGIIVEDIVLYVPCDSISLELESAVSGCQTQVTANVEGFQAPTFHWSDGTASTSNTFPTVTMDTIIVWVQDVRCCLLTDTIVVVPSSNMTVSLPADTALCLPNGNVFTISPVVSNPNAPVSYVWNNNSTGSSLSVSASGIYWVEVSDNCATIRDSIVVTVLPMPEITGLVNTTVCEGAFPINLIPTVTSGASVLWNNGATTVTSSISGAGNVTLQATNSCGTTSVSILVSQTDLPGVSLTASIDTCLQNGQTVALIPVLNNVSNVSWSNGATGNSINVSQTGIYTVYGSNSCNIDSASCSVVIREFPEITGLSDLAVCEGNFPINLAPTVTAGASILWNNGATTINNSVSAPGNVTLQVTNSCGTASATIVVSQIDLPEVSLIASIDSCLQTGQTIALVPVLDNASTVSWSNGTNGNSLSVSQTGVYTVYGSNSCGVDSASCSVLVRRFPDLDLPAILDTCFEIGVGFNYTAQGDAGIYQWNSGSQTATELITQEGLYICTLTNQCGSTVDSMTVNRLADLDLFMPNDSLMVCEEQISINLLQIETNYDYELFAPWTGHPAESLIAESGWYRIRAFNSCGEIWDSIYVELQDEQTLYMPNSFTPNGDGINDQLELAGVNIVVTSFQIFNRWGEEVCSLENNYQPMPVTAWDGTYNGQLCPDGMYMVKVIYVNCFGTPTQFLGHVNLLR